MTGIELKKVILCSTSILEKLAECGMTERPMMLGSLLRLLSLGIVSGTHSLHAAVWTVPLSPQVLIGE